MRDVLTEQDRTLCVRLAQAMGWEIESVTKHPTQIIETQVRCGEREPLSHLITWSGMGRVIEHMQALGWYYYLGDFGDAHDVNRAIFVRPGFPTRDCHVQYASTAPHAVALAALAIYGKENGHA